MKQFRKTLITLSLALPVSFSAIAANNDNGAMQGSMMGMEDSCQLSADQIQIQTLSDDVIDMLKFMREEEKLARDVYQVLYAQTSSPVFNNISASEQKHMDSVKVFLDAYGIEDPASEVAGEFNNTELQALYDQLIAQGSISLLEAYKVGALIEEVDIIDLQDAIENTGIVELKAMYTQLLNGSYNHLRAFSRQIIQANENGIYTAQLMDQAEVDTILAGEHSHMQPGNANSFSDTDSMTSSSCFTSSLSVDQQTVQNGSTINGSQAMSVAYQVNVDAEDVGQTADWVLVAGYTPSPNEPTQLFVRNAEQWQNWNGQMDSLPAAMMNAELQQQQNVPVFEGSLNDMPGNYSIYVGYRLNDNRLVYNKNPLVFSVNP
mgnify:CR=1 FL=1